MVFREPQAFVHLDGVQTEETLFVNAIGPYFLNRQLVGLMNPYGRLVFVTSRLHLPDSRGVPVQFDFADPNMDKGVVQYTTKRAYKNSKLAVLWITYFLAQEFRENKVALTVNDVCFVPSTVQIKLAQTSTYVLDHETHPAFFFCESASRCHNFLRQRGFES